MISAITEIELLCWKTATTNDIKVLKKFIGDAYVIELEQPVKDLTVDIRKRYNLKLPDAIIASSALANDLTLITRNTKDFERINKLKLVNPFDAPNSRN
ncbi:type II toxin-antitoxin system VapC family toxin [Parapedobacter indicus]|uniref:type II toxin-antitoxin system VapC family toxin n=1 Tax=Parapedobacter indicus TaxID=1477437 RepID=UPI000B8A505B|nr:type II toxin-antitoxin system VapC family toxin [Parapedobacter indicus]